METVFEHIQKMGIFLVFASVLIYLLPSKEYEKYVRLLLISVLILYFASPFINLLGENGQKDFRMMTMEYYSEILDRYSSSNLDADSFSKELEEKVEEEWKKWGMSYLNESQIKEE